MSYSDFKNSTFRAEFNKRHGIGMDQVNMPNNAYTQAIKQPATLAGQAKGRAVSIADIMRDTRFKERLTNTCSVATDNNKYLDTDGNLVLPEEILKLIDNKQFLPRYTKCAREFGVAVLLQLAEIARTKAKPSHFFAKSVGKKAITKEEQAEANKSSVYDHFVAMTAPAMKRLIEKKNKLVEELKRRGVDLAYLPYFLKAQNKLGHAFYELMSLSREKKSPARWLSRSIALELDKC